MAGRNRHCIVLPPRRYAGASLPFGRDARAQAAPSPSPRKASPKPQPRARSLVGPEAHHAKGAPPNREKRAGGERRLASALDLGHSRLLRAQALVSGLRRSRLGEYVQSRPLQGRAPRCIGFRSMPRPPRTMELWRVAPGRAQPSPSASPLAASNPSKRSHRSRNVGPHLPWKDHRTRCPRRAEARDTYCGCFPPFGGFGLVFARPRGGLEAAQDPGPGPSRRRAPLSGVVGGL